MADCEHACYHCGLPVPDGADFAVDISGASRSMCCRGCQAVAEAIVAGGLGDYYRHRSELPVSPAEAVPEALSALRQYDHEAVQAGFVSQPAEHEKEASLMLEGITCAACVWLNETHLARLPGVSAVHINYTTRRARVRWDTRQLALSDILVAIAAIGYRACPYDPGRQEQLARREARQALWRVFVAGFGSMQVMMYALPGYIAGEGDMPADIARLLLWASLLLTLPVVGYSAAPFFRNAWRDLRLRRLGMDVPVALGVGLAFCASLWAMFARQGEVYFDSVAMFVFFLLSGRYFELRMRQRAAATVEGLSRLQPLFADRLPAGETDPASAERVPAATLVVGDVVWIRPGEAVPADGVVLSGASAVDEALLTGESRPVAKASGDGLVGGGVNRDSPLMMRVVQVGTQTRLAQIVALMERAASERPHLATLADRYAAWFVFALLLVAVTVAWFWWRIDPSQVLPVTVAVLVVSCPCALSLATPAALTAAQGGLARMGLLVTRGHAVEALAQVSDVVFDKTGTLTMGCPSLLATEPLGALSAENCLCLAAALGAGSEHPLAHALVEAAGTNRSVKVSAVCAVPGQGLEGHVDGRKVRIGGAAYVAGLLPENAPDSGFGGAADEGAESHVWLGDESGWLARFRLADAPRPDAAATVAALREQGCAVHLLSGDRQPAVAWLAGEVGIDRREGALGPADKQARVAEMQARGAVVAMVGDGVNDAPVLATAQVSLAMGGGTDLAHASADVVLLGSRLSAVPEGRALCRKARRIIHQNLAWALLYNGLAIPLAAAGFVAPWMAGLGMSASSALVVANSLRLQGRP